MKKSKRTVCAGETWCPGLTSNLGRKEFSGILRVALIVNMENTREEWNVVVLGKFGRKQPIVPLNYCPWCGARINKAYYDHCLEPEPAR